MHFTTKDIIAELIRNTEMSTRTVCAFKALSPAQLNFRKTDSSWSVLECIEHLNLYGDFYLPEIELKMIAQRDVPFSPKFKSGVLGNYFANLMKGKDGKITKMNSPKDKVPDPSTLSTTTLDRFLKQQELLVSLLYQAESMNLTKVKTAISLSKWINLRLGDTLRFYVNHIERHVAQAKRNLES